MPLLIRASAKAIGSVFAPGMLGVFIASLGWTLAALIGFIALMTSLAAFAAPLITDPVLSAWLPWAGGLGATMLAYMLFPGIMPVIVNFFDNRIATVIERQDYPAAHPIEPPFWPEFLHDLRFSLMAIALNILVLPLYLVPIVQFFVFPVLNGHLLGREFFVMVARRYLPLEEAKALRARHGRPVFISGVLLTVLATIPLLNLFAPFWGIAVMTHLYHALAHTPKMEVIPPR